MAASLVIQSALLTPPYEVPGLETVLAQVYSEGFMLSDMGQRVDGAWSAMLYDPPPGGEGVGRFCGNVPCASAAHSLWLALLHGRERREKVLNPEIREAYGRFHAWRMAEGRKREPVRPVPSHLRDDNGPYDWLETPRDVHRQEKIDGPEDGGNLLGRIGAKVRAHNPGSAGPRRATPIGPISLESLGLLPKRS